MSRLASLTPSRARHSPSPSPSPAPASPARLRETTHHRQLRAVLDAVRKLADEWDQVVGYDAFKAAKGCVDEATVMDNILLTLDGPERPAVRPHLEALYAHRSALTAALNKLDLLLRRLAGLLDAADKVFFDAVAVQGYGFCCSVPLWATWTLQHFVDSLGPLVSQHNAHLALFRPLARTLLDPATAFDDSKLALERWRDLALGGARWDAVREWGELVALETREDKDEGEKAVGVSKKNRR
ncbi:hypothetical protein Q5752_001349 [Cryptotrichosporon argae]